MPVVYRERGSPEVLRVLTPCLQSTWWGNENRTRRLLHGFTGKRQLRLRMALSQCLKYCVEIENWRIKLLNSYDGAIVMYRGCFWFAWFGDRRLLSGCAVCLTQPVAVLHCR